MEFEVEPGHEVIGPMEIGVSLNYDGSNRFKELNGGYRSSMGPNWVFLLCLVHLQTEYDDEVPPFRAWSADPCRQ